MRIGEMLALAAAAEAEQRAARSNFRREVTRIVIELRHKIWHSGRMRIESRQNPTIKRLKELREAKAAFAKA